MSFIYFFFITLDTVLESQSLKPFGIFPCSQRKQYLIQSLFWVLDSVIEYYFQSISMGRKPQISYAPLKMLLSDKINEARFFPPRYYYLAISEVRELSEFF